MVEVIVGVNKYVVKKNDSTVQVLSIDNSNVRNAQVPNFNNLRLQNLKN